MKRFLTLAMAAICMVSLVQAQSIFWTDMQAGTIQRTDLTNSNTTDLLSDLIEPRHVVVGDGKMYWVEGEQSWGRQPKIRRANYDGSGIEDLVLVDASLRFIRDLALDLANGKLYWTEWHGGGPGYDGGVFRSNLDGSEIEGLVSGGSGAIALDPSHGKMYFKDARGEGSYGGIMEANLDGSWLTQWMEVYADAFAVDPDPDLPNYAGESMRLYYFVDGAIHHSSSQVTPLVQDSCGHPCYLRLDLVRGMMYWTSTSYRIRRASLLGAGIEDLVVTNGTSIGGFSILDETAETSFRGAESSGSYVLLQNYPDPFNASTTISYRLPRAADVTLAVYDVLGRRVGELASGTQPPGTYEVTFDATSLPSGIYFYRLQAGDYADTKRMVVVR